LSFCRLPISLWFTSYLLLCPKLTDAPYSGYGAYPPLPFPKWRLHSQGPHTLPFQGARHLQLFFTKIFVSLYVDSHFVTETNWETILFYCLLVIKKICIQAMYCTYMKEKTSINNLNSSSIFK
jgi:hypothetical protein